MIDWYFHAADLKTRMDRDSNNVSPHYVQARQDEGAVMYFDSNFAPIQSNQGEPFQFDQQAPQAPQAISDQLQLPPTPPSTDSLPESRTSQQTEQPVVTDYGAHRTNDASIWYLRQFKSQASQPDSQYRESRESHHQPTQSSMHYSQQGDTFTNHLSRPMTQGPGVSSDPYNSNQYTTGTGSYGPKSQSEWRTSLPSTDEFNLAFNSVVAGGDPEANDSVRQMKRSDQLKQPIEPSTTAEPVYMERVKFDDQATDQVSFGSRGQEGVVQQPTTYAPFTSSPRHVLPPARPFMPIMYEPPGFPPRFYRLRL